MSVTTEAKSPPKPHRSAFANFMIAGTATVRLRLHLYLFSAGLHFRVLVLSCLALPFLAWSDLPACWSSCITVIFIVFSSACLPACTFQFLSSCVSICSRGQIIFITPSISLYQAGACFFSNPMEVVKTRLQLQGVSPTSSPDSA